MNATFLNEISSIIRSFDHSTHMSTMYGNDEYPITSFGDAEVATQEILNEPVFIPEWAKIKEDNVKLPVQFFILDSFSPETFSFFESCADNLKRKEQFDPSVNFWQFSYLGARYFTKDRLELHEWYNSSVTMLDADVLIVPFQFTMAITGQCGKSTNKNAAKKEIENAINSVIDLGEKIKDKAILINLHDYRFNCGCCPELEKLLHKLADMNAHVYRANCDAHAVDNTISTPYTTPFALDQYQEFNDENQFEHWKNRSFSLFLMGSVCRPGHAVDYFHRSLALEYFEKFNKNNVATVGVVTDGYKDYEKKAGLCGKSGGVYDSYNECDGDLNSLNFPCYVNDKEAFKDNKFYIEGMKNSKFNLMIHGDTPTSGKFYDSIAFNMINIMIGITKQNKMHYLPFADVIPYEDFLFFIEPKEFEQNGYELLENIIHNTEDAVYQSMMSNLTLYKKHILWDMNESLVVNNILREVVNKETQ